MSSFIFASSVYCQTRFVCGALAMASIVSSTAGCRSTSLSHNVESRAATQAQAVPVHINARWENHCPCCMDQISILITNDEQRVANDNCGFKSPAFQEIAWSEYDCLMVAAGSQPGRLWWSRIDRVVRQDQALHIHATLGHIPSQGPNTSLSAKSTEPVSLLLIDKQSGIQSIRTFWRREEPGVGYHPAPHHP